MVEVQKSTNITNIETQSQVTLEGKQGYIRCLIDTVAAATTSIDDIGDIILFGPIPSNAVLLDIEFLNDEIDSDNVLVGLIGLYYSGLGGDQASNTAKTSGTVIDADCISADCATLAAVNTAYSSVRFDTADIANAGYEAWQLGGLSSDPGGLFFVGFKVSTAATTPVAGDVTIKITYFVN